MLESPEDKINLMCCGESALIVASFAGAISISRTCVVSVGNGSAMDELTTRVLFECVIAIAAQPLTVDNTDAASNKVFVFVVSDIHAPHLLYQSVSLQTKRRRTNTGIGCNGRQNKVQTLL